MRGVGVAGVGAGVAATATGRGWGGAGTGGRRRPRRPPNTPFSTLWYIVCRSMGRLIITPYDGYLVTEEGLGGEGEGVTSHVKY